MNKQKMEVTMKKRIISITVFLAVVLAGCGQINESTTSVKNNKENQTSANMEIQTEISTSNSYDELPNLTEENVEVTTANSVSSDNSKETEENAEATTINSASSNDPKETEDINSVSDRNENIDKSNKSDISVDDVFDKTKGVIVNNVAYMEFNPGTETYTPNVCLGSPCDYNGNYKGFFSDISATLYTTKESTEVLIVEESDNVVYLHMIYGSNDVCDTIYTSYVDWYNDGSELTEDVWNNINSEHTAIVKNTNELKAYLSPIYSEAVISQYLQKYNDDFFNNNVLLLNTIYQGAGWGAKYVIDDITLNNAINITLKNCRDEVEVEIMSLCLAQVAITKEAYNDKAVSWTVS